MPMIKTFTQDDLIRFLYRETSEEENKELKKALTHEPELKVQLEELQATIKNLDGTLMNPSDDVVNRILSYSKGT